jgi:hypothetical protein
MVMGMMATPPLGIAVSVPATPSTRILAMWRVLVASGNGRRRRCCISILGRRIVHNPRIRGVWLRETANYGRGRRIIFMTVTNGRHTLRWLMASTITVASSTTSATPVCLMSSLTAPLRLAWWRRGSLIGVWLRGGIRGLLGILRGRIRLRSIVWMIVRCRERNRSMRMAVVCGSMAMLWSPLRLRSWIAIRRRMGAAVRNCVLGRIWLPSVLVTWLRAVVVATTPMEVAAPTTA